MADRRPEQITRDVDREIADHLSLIYTTLVDLADDLKAIRKGLEEQRQGDHRAFGEMDDGVH